jgi:hypothetical protein
MLMFVTGNLVDRFVATGVRAAPVRAERAV